ncbi:MAG TPA: type II toxin-antitoxin system HigB family toxin [Allosphingosinicella sp.]|nr:type II toxin-antitoxin system HigB family toxin [Allosphingosinicella sp.]
MRVIALKRSREHWGKHGRGDSEQPLKAWYAIVRTASWRHFADVKAQFGTASIVGERVVFNIAGNKYRLAAYINFAFHTVYIRFVGTHAEYDRLDIERV